MLSKSKQLTMLLLAVLGFAGCATKAPQEVDIEKDLKEVYAELYDDEIVRFFEGEAVKAGVKKIRKMLPTDVLPRVNEYEIAGCAYAFKETKTILIEVEKPLCVKLSHLAHEISHIGSDCSGHNDVFYKYNFAVAKRYQEAFPDSVQRQWFDPVQDVANVAAIYRSKGC